MFKKQPELIETIFINSITNEILSKHDVFIGLHDIERKFKTLLSKHKLEKIRIDIIIKGGLEKIYIARKDEKIELLKI